MRTFLSWSLQFFLYQSVGTNEREINPNGKKIQHFLNRLFVSRISKARSLKQMKFLTKS